MRAPQGLKSGLARLSGTAEEVAEKLTNARIAVEERPFRAA